ncbi:MAG: hypothetical protein ACOCVY_00125 [Patescibacteria group bacterium]
MIDKNEHRKIKNSRDLREYIDKHVTNRAVLGGVGELVEENQKNWIREKFKKELLARLDFFLEEYKKSSP